MSLVEVKNRIYRVESFVFTDGTARGVTTLIEDQDILSNGEAVEIDINNVADSTVTKAEDMPPRKR